MKFTHNALASITVEKVENITTSMTRAGLGDDTYRRQRDKERYLKFKTEQAEKEEKMRDDFLKGREEKIKGAEERTLKKSQKRQKKKDRQKQLKKKTQLLKKLQGDDSSDSEGGPSEQAE